MAWSETLDRLNVDELRNLMLSGANCFNVIKQDVQGLEDWAKTEEAQSLTEREV
jgi:hypothetical protein